MPLGGSVPLGVSVPLVARRLRADRWQGCDGALIAETYSDLTVHLLFDHELDPARVEALRVAHAQWPGALRQRQVAGKGGRGREAPRRGLRQVLPVALPQ